MAISGSGTQNDPYAVHNYTELRDIILLGENTYWTDGQIIYITLEGNVSSKAWEKMDTNSVGHACQPVINLNRHWLIAGSNRALYEWLPRNSWLWNGIIKLNFDWTNDGIMGMVFYNVRMYITTKHPGASFISVFNGCRVYNAVIECKITSVICFAYRSDFEYCNIDIRWHRGHLTSTPSCFFGDATTMSESTANRMYRCYVHGQYDFSIDRTNVIGGLFARNYYMLETAFDIDMSNIVIENKQPEDIIQVFENCVSYGSCINSDLVSHDVVVDTVTGVTTTQLHSGSDLRNIGFPVLDEVI